MRTLVFLATTMFLVPVASSQQVDDKEKIKALIPTAAAISRKDWLKIAMSSGMPKSSDIENMPLTMIVLITAVQPSDTEQQLEEFNYDGNATPRPAELSKEFMRPLIGKLFQTSVTALHFDRITKFTCEVKENSAKGYCKFKVPGLYTGKVNYIAKKTKAGWQITEFVMPARKIHLKYDGKKWTTAKKEEAAKR